MNIKKIAGYIIAIPCLVFFIVFIYIASGWIGIGLIAFVCLLATAIYWITE